MVIKDIQICASQWDEYNLKNFIQNVLEASKNNPDEIKWALNETGISCVMIWYKNDR